MVIKGIDYSYYYEENDQRICGKKGVAHKEKMKNETPDPVPQTGLFPMNFQRSALNYHVYLK
jgi:hypothetical protein